MSEVKVSGPLFEGRLDVKGGRKAGMDEVAKLGASLVLQQLAQRSRFRTPKYGHVLDAVRTQVKPLSGGELGARIYLGGQSAYLGPWLEYGTKGHDIPKEGRRKARTHIQTVRASGGLRRALIRTTDVRLFLPIGGGLIRSYSLAKPFKKRGTPGYFWREKAQAALEPQVQSILQRAMDEALTR